MSVVAHIVSGPLDLFIELGLPLLLFVALYWWSRRGGGGKEGGR